MPHARISEALRALVFEPDPDEELHRTLDRYYAPGYTHRSDGRTLNREEFAHMVAGVRGQITKGEVTVLDEIRDGDTYAERHVFHLTLADGATQSREIAIFGTFAEDGRFQNLSETGFDVAVDETR
ncbi:nuclear transport factor 2 family protein [Streptomyces sp. NPDC001068]|uniref:nuclear transport factor 2 family protein n=1 Tax=Streptomyces sp. NPDC001068 TaxID=3364544 RepID=UPI0036B43B8B